MSRMTLGAITKGRIARPLRIVLGGVDGIGKTTWASQAPAPIFIGAEDGAANLDVARFPAAETWVDIMDAIGTLYAEEHEFQTVVIDSADWAEAFAVQAVCDEQGVNGIEAIGYGKGWTFAAEKFLQMLRGLDALVTGRGLNVIVIAHVQVKPFNDPENEPYERYTLKLHKASDARLREWCDCHLFANYDTTVKTVGEGFNATKRAVSYGKRLIFTERRAAFDAKNRFGLPDRLPLEWPAFWAAYCAATGRELKAVA